MYKIQHMCTRTRTHILILHAIDFNGATCDMIQFGYIKCHLLRTSAKNEMILIHVL